METHSSKKFNIEFESLQPFSTLPFSSQDLLPIREVSLDHFQTFLVKNEERFVLKILKKEERAIEDIFFEFLFKLQEVSLIPKTIPSYINIEGRSYLAFLQEKIHPILYPPELTPTMIQDIGIKILQLVRIANQYGFTLKDAHAWNSILYKFHPLWIDIGSFEYVPNGIPPFFWGLSEFYSRFYIPLQLAKKGFLWEAKNLYSTKTTVPIEKLIPNSSFVKKYFYRAKYSYIRYNSIIYRPDSEILGKIQKRSVGLPIVLIYKILKQLDFPFRISLEKLEEKIQTFSFQSTNTRWANYYNIKTLKFPKRYPSIARYIQQLGIQEITDIGGNMGLLGFYLLNQNLIKKYICIDPDIGAIDLGYQLAKERNLTSCSFVAADPFNESSHSDLIPLHQRFQSQCVTALALLHHLILTQKYDPSYCLRVLSQFTSQYALIEFMPLGLYDGTSPPPPVPPEYNLEWFKNLFCQFFELIVYEEIDVNRVLFVGKKLTYCNT